MSAHKDPRILGNVDPDLPYNSRQQIKATCILEFDFDTEKDLFSISNRVATEKNRHAGTGQTALYCALVGPWQAFITLLLYGRKDALSILKLVLAAIRLGLISRQQKNKKANENL